MRRAFALLFILTIVVSLGSAPQARAATSEFRALWVDAAGRPESRVQPAWTEQDGIRKLAGSEVRRGTARERELGRELVLRPRPSRRSRLHRRDVPLGGAKLRHRRPQLRSRALPRSDASILAAGQRVGIQPRCTRPVPRSDRAYGSASPERSAVVAMPTCPGDEHRAQGLPRGSRDEAVPPHQRGHHYLRRGPAGGRRLGAEPSVPRDAPGLAGLDAG